MKGVVTKIIVGAGLILALVGCTRERPYDEIFKDQTSQSAPQSKSLVDASSEYLYVPSAVNSTRTTDATFPMYMGDAKIVRLELTESSIKVLEVEDDPRFGDNDLNSKPVLEIPISHVDYQCAKDADGRCTQREEENNDVTWSKKRYFKVNGNSLAVQEINFLPIEITNLFYPCYNEVGSEFVDFKIENDAINARVEKTYKSDIACAGNIRLLSDLTFRVQYHYSLVKLNSITTPGYKPLAYSRAEETTFGYFDSRTLKLDVDNTEGETGEKVFLNRWNPSRTVTYTLTPNFNKPQNAKLKAVTIAAVESMNRSLEKSGAALRIEVKEAAEDFQPADLRHSSIVLVEDPVNFGILGYGPSAANPRTGEIVQGRAAMYVGVIKQGIREAYDDLVTEKLRAQDQAKAGADNAGNVTPSQYTLDEKLIAKQTKTVRTKYSELSTVLMRRDSRQLANSEAAHVHANHVAPLARPAKLSKTPANLKSRVLRKEARKIRTADVAKMEEDPSIKDLIMSKHCYFPADLFNFNDAVEDEIDQVLAEVGYKPWLELSEADREKVIDALLPFVWVPTLIHEIGHTLGLRHNFAGSEDVANFYTEEELKEMGARRAFKYSSVMDYGWNSTNELQLLGKYDIAALRFAYAEKVELADGQIVELERWRTEPGLTLKDYAYCTDEHVEVNPGCNRFDEGKNLTEIAEHLVRSHEIMYWRRSLRNGRYDFSLFDDITQARRLRRVFGGLRAMFERYEDIKHTFGLADNDPVWEELDFLKELKDSSRMAGNFFMNVLKTPDVLCAVAEKRQPNLIVALAPIRMLSPFGINCFDDENVQLNDAYVVVGEAGKSFQSRKDPRSGNPYIDQIDVRGIWIDKLMAAQALVGRTTGIETYDEYTDNFLDLTDMRAAVEETLAGLLHDEVVAETAIRTIDGGVLVAPIAVRFFDAAEGQNPHRLTKHISSVVRRAFALPNENTTFQEQLVRVLKASLPSRNQIEDVTSFMNSITVNTGLPLGSSPANFIAADIGLSTYFIHLQSMTAGLLELNRQVVTLLSALGEEKVTEILIALLSGLPLPEEATAEERLAYSLGADYLYKFLTGGFQDKSYYELAIRSLAL